MTLTQKKISAFCAVVVCFLLQVFFSIKAQQDLHVYHHQIEEEWEELSRIQSLEDLLDGQRAILTAVADGQAAIPVMPGSATVRAISGILEKLPPGNEDLSMGRSGHQQVEERYLVRIVAPLQKCLKDYTEDFAKGAMTPAKARAYLQQVTDIQVQNISLRQADAGFAREALERAQLARRQTLRDSLIFSGILFLGLVGWAVYFFINLGYQTNLEIARQKMTAAGILAQSVAHEIRNPLGIIKSSADLLARRNTLDTEGRELAVYMVEEVDRIDGLIRELLSLSSSRDVPRQMADIGAIIRSVLELARGRLGEAGVSVNFSNQASGVLCSCIPGQIRQVVLNLFLNAIAVSPKDSTIDIVTRKQDNSYVIMVKDHGPGFAPGAKEKMFDLFYTTRESGFGIGLAVVKHIVENHGGTVTAQNVVDDPGALFTVFLPLA